jgi:hypothetical protein
MYTEPWGFSKLDTFQQCKKRFFFQYVQKLPSPSNAAMERGGKIHETIESYLQGWITSMPEDQVPAVWKPRLDELKAMPNFTSEQAIGLDKNWRPLKDWFQKETWLRAKMDAKSTPRPEHLSVVDFKTGKYRVPSDEQIELYAIVGQAQHPEVEVATAEFWFIDLDDVYSKTFQGPALLALRKKYENLADQIYKTEVWIEEPSRECKWCPYSKSRGGPCKF